MLQVTVDAWSDFTCPWCWIAKRKFGKAVRSLQGRLEVVVNERAYRLARGMAPESFKMALHRKLGTLDAAQRLMSAVEQGAQSEGLEYCFDGMRFGDTTAAHALVKFVAPVARPELVEHIFGAFVTESQDIFDKSVLRKLAARFGVSAPVDFEDRKIVSAIALDELEVKRFGTGVPLFAFNGRLFLSGVHETEAFRQVILKAAEDAADADDARLTSCGAQGC